MNKVNVEYEFHYHGVYHYRLGEYGIHLKCEGKMPYVLGARFGHEEEWKNEDSRRRVKNGKLRHEIEWVLETHFEMPTVDCKWFSEQINDDFVKHIASKGVKL